MKKLPGDTKKRDFQLNSHICHLLTAAIHLCIQEWLNSRHSNSMSKLLTLLMIKFCIDKIYKKDIWERIKDGSILKLINMFSILINYHRKLTKFNPNKLQMTVLIICSFCRSIKSCTILLHNLFFFSKYPILLILRKVSRL